MTRSAYILSSHVWDTVYVVVVVVEKAYFHKSEKRFGLTAAIPVRSSGRILSGYCGLTQ